MLAREISNDPNRRDRTCNVGEESTSRDPCAAVHSVVLGIAVVAILFPRIVAWTVAAVAILAGVFLLFRAVRTNARRARKRRAAPPA